MFALTFPLALPRPNRADRTAMPAALVALLVLTLALQLVLRAPVTLPEPQLSHGFRLQPVVVAPRLVDPQLETRPLFAPGRRQSGEGAAATSAPMGGARVVGAVTVRGAVRLFLQMPDGRVQPLSIGGRVDGWRFDALTPLGARFSRAGESSLLAIGASPPRRTATAETDASAEEEPQ